MNKAIQKMMMALAVCGVLCGTAMAAPKGNPPPKGGKAPTAMKAQAPMAAKARPAPVRQVSKAPTYGNAHHVAPAKHEPRHEVVHHNPPPPAHHHHEPKHHHHHHDHHNSTLHTEDWCEIGASLIGGLIGGLIGAAS